MKDYYPYGTERVSATGAPGYRNRYSFGNKELDQESGLSYFENRHYSASAGRFTQRDPVFRELGRTKRAADLLSDPQQWNSYSYARDNPVMFADPTGEAIDAFFDVGMVTYDVGTLYYNSARLISDAAIYKYAEYKGDEHLMDVVAAKVDAHVQGFKEAWTDTVADALAVTIPFIPAWGTKVVRTANMAKAERLESATRLADEAAKKIRQNEKSIRSYQQRISEHRDKMTNPEKYLNDPAKRKEYGANPKYREWLINHWQKEIDTFKSNIKKLENENKSLWK